MGERGKSAADIADRYITRGGAEPGRTRTDASGDIVTLANFILWHDDGHLMGGVRRDEAFEAMCRLLNVEAHRIRAIIRPPETD